MPCQKLEQHERQHRQRKHHIVEIPGLLFADGREHNKGRKYLQHITRECCQWHRMTCGINQAEKINESGVESIDPFLARKLPRAYETKHYQSKHKYTHAQVKHGVDRIETQNSAVLHHYDC